MHLRKRNPLSLKRHLFLHGNRMKIQTQGFLDLFFDAALHLEYFFQVFELSTKAASPKAAFDTLQYWSSGEPTDLSPALACGCL